jgi:hypothetical protein
VVLLGAQAAVAPRAECNPAPHTENAKVRQIAPMRKVRTFAAAVFLAVCAWTPQVAADPVLHPGLWEIQRQRTGGPGGNANAPETSSERICTTTQSLTSDPAQLFRQRPPQGQNTQGQGNRQPTCTIANVSMSGGTVRYTASCQGPMGQMRMNWAGTYTATTFDVSTAVRLGFRTMNARQTGRRVGACE